MSSASAVPAGEPTAPSTGAGRPLSPEAVRVVSFEIREARSPLELEDVYRFRYRIYVEEMGRKQKHADHERRRIEDPLDDRAANFAAWRDGAVVGVVRVNLAREAGLDGYDTFYEMASAGADHPAHTSIVTRLMVAPECRRTRLPLALATRCYEYGLEHGVRWNFIDCNDHLCRFFAALGYVPHAPRAVHEEYGMVNRLRLRLHDTAHLEAVRSPFLGVLRGRDLGANPAAAGAFRQ